uniref:Uncharacterized protein n=1 Tax=Kalanchoe fedtschenkoi TaxID=63787 RepID=A0A7N1A3U7_KALFE
MAYANLIEKLLESNYKVLPGLKTEVLLITWTQSEGVTEMNSGRQCRTSSLGCGSYGVSETGLDMGIGGKIVLQRKVRAMHVQL